MAQVIDIYLDWRMVAKEFPFLEINITLFNDEAGTEDKPIWRNSEWLEDYATTDFKPMVSMRIRNGKIALVDPWFEDVHKNDLVPDTYTLPMELSDPKDPRIILIDHMVNWFETHKWVSAEPAYVCDDEFKKKVTVFITDFIRELYGECINVDVRYKDRPENEAVLIFIAAPEIKDYRLGMSNYSFFIIEYAKTLKKVYFDVYLNLSETEIMILEE
jgi:hypothetical protein